LSILEASPVLLYRVAHPLYPVFTYVTVVNGIPEQESLSPTREEDRAELISGLNLKKHMYYYGFCELMFYVVKSCFCFEQTSKIKWLYGDMLCLNSCRGEKEQVYYGE
jgi:hypothetical protein